MKRVMVGLMAGVVVILMLTSPLAAYDRDVTLPSPNQSNPVWMYENGTGDDTGWIEPTRGNARPNRILEPTPWYCNILSHGFWSFFHIPIIKIQEVKADRPILQNDLTTHGSTDAEN